MTSETTPEVSQQGLEAELQRIEDLWAESGRTVAFVRVRIDDDVSDASVQDSRALDPRLASTAVDPMSIPVDALAEQLDLDVFQDVRIEKRGEEGALVQIETLLTSPRPPGSERTAPPVQDADTTTAQIRQSVDDVLASDRNIIYTDDGRLLTYLSFHPAVPFDAAQRVDWLDGTTHAGATRRELLQLGEAERRVEIEALFATSAAAAAARSGCELVSASDIAHAGYFACSYEDLHALADEQDLIRGIQVMTEGEAATGMLGDDFRADDGAQLRLALTRDDSGLECNQSGGTRVCHDGSAAGDIEVALLDAEGFYRMHEHPALDDTQGGATRVERRRNCTSTGCVSFASWEAGGLFNGHGTRAMSGAFAHLLQGQDANCWIASCVEARSNAGYEAALTLTWVQADWQNAIEDAVDLGVDMVVISHGIDAGVCETADIVQDNMRDAWDYAYSLGTLGVWIGW